MEFEWDEAKRQANLAKHGVDFADTESFDWAGALRWPDQRRDHGEIRFLALGEIRGRVHSISFTMRGRTLRIISLRKANDRETKRYEEEKKA